jgi:hypothetical protein
MLRYLNRTLCIALLPLLAACNFPTILNQIIEGQSTPTPTELSLQDIEAIVAGTLAVELQSAQDLTAPSPTDADADSSSLPTPSLTPSPTLTPTATETSTPPRCTVLAQGLHMRYGPGTVYAPPIATWSQGTELEPLARNPDSTWIEAEELVQNTVGWISGNTDLLECNVPIPSLTIGIIPPTPTPSYTPTPQPTDTSTPSATPCPKFTNATLAATVGSGNSVSLVWGSTGGCGPITGTLTATYKGESSPYSSYSVSGRTGKLTDKPPVRCEGSFSIVYSLVLKDGIGQTLSVSTSARVTWIC